MVPVFRPQDEAELALAVGALEAHGIPYFVHNNGFGGLYPGMQVSLYNVRTVMVPASALTQARDVLDQFLVNDPNSTSGDEQPQQEQKPTLSTKFRLLVELLAGGWCVPRKVKRRSL